MVAFRAGGGGGANSEFEVEGGGDIITRAPLKCEDDIELNAGLADELRVLQVVAIIYLSQLGQQLDG